MAILFLVFSTGFFSIISQTILLREFFVILNGNEFYLGIILSIWLTGVFLGAITGRNVKKKYDTSYLLSLISLALFLPLQIFLIRVLFLLTGTHSGQMIPFLKLFLYSFPVIIPVSFLIGFQFPIAVTRVDSSSLKFFLNESGKISAIYIIESSGAFFAGVIYTYFLVSKFTNYEVTFFISAFLLSAVGFYSLYLKDRVFFFSALISGILFIIAVITPIYKVIDKKSNAIRWSGISETKLAVSKDSKYQNIIVSVDEEQKNIFLNGKFSGSFPDNQSALKTAANIYVQNKNNNSILIVDGPDYYLFKTLKKFGFKRILFTEQDKKLVEIIEKFHKDKSMEFAEFKKSFLFTDVRTLISDSEVRFDVVFINSAEPSSLSLNRNYTMEFFNSLKKILAEDGTVVLRVSSADNYKSGFFSYYSAIIYKTFEKVFQHTVSSGGERAYLFGTGKKGIVSDDPDVLEERFILSGVEPKKLKYIFRDEYEKEYISKKRDFLSKLKDVPVNSDMFPVAVNSFNKLESNLRGDGNLITRFKNFNFLKILLFSIPILLFPAIFLLFRSGYSSGKKTFLTFGITLFNAGLSSMSIVFIVIYTYQILRGNLYSIIGLIIAFFMAGIPLGALFFEFLKKKMETDGFIKKSELFYLIHIVLVVIIGLPVFIMKNNLFNTGLVEAVLPLFTIIAGGVGGCIFSISVDYLSPYFKKGINTAGFADAFDHLGGAAGAILTGIILLPLWGVELAAVFLITLQVLSMTIFYFRSRFL